MSTFFSGFAVLMQPVYWMYMIGGVAFGSILAFLPGLTAATGIALMLPITYTMEPLEALVFLISIYSGGMFAGGATAILINTPGSNANIATCFDGYPMHQKGETERALGLALMSSVIGGVIGSVCLVCLAGPMANIALKFGPGEMFMVAFFGLSVVGSLSEDVIKSLFSGLAGILFGTIGVNAMGITRGTLGSIYLLEGVPLIPLLIGLLALPSIFALISQSEKETKVNANVSFKKLIGGCMEVIRKPLRSIICSLAGVIVGIIPAAGASVAGILCYNQSKQLSKEPEKYGTGIPEGITSVQSAANASEGGALATMFVLGIPGSNASAMILGAVMLLGWTPGPKMFSDHADVIYTVFSSIILQQILVAVIGLVLCLLAAKLVKLPVKYLAPAIIMFTVIGAFSSRYALFDPWLMLFFAVMGWFMKKSDYPTMPLVLGVLLGSLADENLMRIFQAYDSFWEIFTSPITTGLALISIFSIVFPIIMSNCRKKARNRKAE